MGSPGYCVCIFIFKNNPMIYKWKVIYYISHRTIPGSLNDATLHKRENNYFTASKICLSPQTFANFVHFFKFYIYNLVNLYKIIKEKNIFGILCAL